MPESLQVPSFVAFMDRMHLSGRLARVVVDECHLALNENWAWRPALQRLDGLVKAATQLVYLTATLPVAMEQALWLKLGVAVQIQVFRSETSRKEIGYHIENVRGLLVLQRDTLLLDAVRRPRGRRYGN